jgi:hypothetical protein
MNMTVCWDLRWVIDMMKEAVDASETSVNFYQTTRRNIPEDNRLQTRYRENPKFNRF